MRFTIILVVCFIGVASASSLNKRSFVDDLQNNTQNAFHAFEQFGQSLNDKLQEAIKNLLNAFGNKEQSKEGEVKVTKRYTNPLQLINDLGSGDPVKFATTFLQVLADTVTLGASQGKREINPAELLEQLGSGDLTRFGQSLSDKFQEAIKNFLKAIENKKQSTEGEVKVTKRYTNPLQLINDLGSGDPVKFATTFLQVLADIATLQG